MSLLVTGSIGIDTVTTPFGRSENCIGGSAVYFSMAASFFSPVRLVGVIGSDCPFRLSEVFAGRNVDLEGLEVRSLSKTFRWKGSYHGAMTNAITDSVELNVLAEKPPIVPQAFRDSKYVFLANTAPALQIELLSQVGRPSFVAADTMNCWIEGRADDLKQLLRKIDCLVVNAEEARALASEMNLIKASEKMLTMGPKIIVIKKGESGSLLCSRTGEKFSLPAYPASEVKDPTGAGDSFAGAMMGRIAELGKSDFATLKQAIAFGTVVSSFTISEFSLNGLIAVKREQIDGRVDELRKLTSF